MMPFPRKRNWQGVFNNSPAFHDALQRRYQSRLQRFQTWYTKSASRGREKPTHDIDLYVDTKVREILTTGNASKLKGLSWSFLDLGHKANPESSLMLACRNPDASCCDAILGCASLVWMNLPVRYVLVNDDGETALHIAVSCGHEEQANAILKVQPRLARVSDVNGETPLHCAVRSSNWAMVTLLMPFSDLQTENNCGLNALHVAVCFNTCLAEFREFAPEELKRAVAEVGSWGQTAQEWGLNTQQDHIQCLRFSLENTNQAVFSHLISVMPEFNFCWLNRKTPLTLATSVSSLVAVSLLLEKGASDMSDGWGIGPATVAAATGCVDILKVFLDKGFTLENNNGTHALSSAVYHLRKASVRVLLRSGCPVNGIGLDRFYVQTPSMRKLLRVAGCTELQGESMESDESGESDDSEHKAKKLKWSAVDSLYDICLHNVRKSVYSPKSNLFYTANQLPLPEPIVMAITFGLSVKAKKKHSLPSQ